MAITISVVRDGEAVERFETRTTDDFYYFRDSVHEALETGEFGSRFPTFLSRFEPDTWKVEEVALLRDEVAAIAEAFKKLPPKPLDANWSSRMEWLEESGQPIPESLYHVFTDAEGEPILGEMLRLCDAALAQGLSMSME